MFKLAFLSQIIIYNLCFYQMYLTNIELSCFSKLVHGYTFLLLDGQQIWAS